MSWLVLTYESNLNIFKTCIMVCGYRNRALDCVHGRIAGNPPAIGSMTVVEVDFDGRLSIVGDVADFVSDLVPNLLHGGGTKY